MDIVSLCPVEVLDFVLFDVMIKRILDKFVTNHANGVICSHTSYNTERHIFEIKMDCNHCEMVLHLQISIDGV